MKIISETKGDNISKQEKQYLSVLILTIVLSSGYFLNKKEVSADFQTDLNNTELASQMTDSKVDFMYENLDLKASSVYVFDTSKAKSVYEKNIEQVMPLASLNKIMTAVVVMENTEQNEVITIPKEALSQVGDNGLLYDEKWGRDDLVRFMLITSSNDAARTFAMHVGAKMGGQTEEESVEKFVSLMNTKSAELGLNNTQFFNESGLDVSLEKNGGYSTAKEIVSLFNTAITKYPEIFNSTSFDSQSFKSLSSADHQAQNTNQSTGKVAGISASKTGFTTLSGGNLIISFNTDSGETFIVAALGSTFADRFTDIEKLSQTTLKIIEIL